MESKRKALISLTVLIMIFINIGCNHSISNESDIITDTNNITTEVLVNTLDSTALRVNTRNLEKKKDIGLKTELDDIIIEGSKKNEIEDIVGIEIDSSNLNINYSNAKVVNNYLVANNLETLLITSYDGELCKLTFEILNKYSNDIILTYSSGQLYDFIVFDDNNDEIYRWSSDKSFITAIIDKTIKKNEKLVFNEEWDFRSKDGEYISDGKYTISFISRFKLDGKREGLQKEVIVELIGGKLIIN